MIISIIHYINTTNLLGLLPRYHWFRMMGLSENTSASLHKNEEPPLNKRTAFLISKGLSMNKANRATGNTESIGGRLQKAFSNYSWAMKCHGYLTTRNGFNTFALEPPRRRLQLLSFNENQHQISY